jgi:hypothetical protein
MLVSNRIFAAVIAAGDVDVCPKSPARPAAMKLRTTGQAALLFPFFWYIDFLSGGLFEKRTAEQILHQQERIRQCFKSAFDAGSCGGWVLGALAVLSLGGTLYTWVGKGSVLANWINLGLAAALALAMMRMGANSTFDVIVIAGWTVLALLGLIEASKSGGTCTPAV